MKLPATAGRINNSTPRIKIAACCDSQPDNALLLRGAPSAPIGLVSVVSASATQRLPSSPCGRIASTMTMITKVKTVA